jgi:hypothetical protein
VSRLNLPQGLDIKPNSLLGLLLDQDGQREEGRGEGEMGQSLQEVKNNIALYAGSIGTTLVQTDPIICCALNRNGCGSLSYVLVLVP